jgi:hypothetical protein
MMESQNTTYSDKSDKEKSLSLKRICLGVLIGITALLDLAALADIVLRKEPDYFQEYAMLVVSVFIFIGAVYVYRK